MCSLVTTSDPQVMKIYCNKKAHSHVHTWHPHNLMVHCAPSTVARTFNFAGRWITSPKQRCLNLSCYQSSAAGSPDHPALYIVDLSLLGFGVSKARDKRNLLPVHLQRYEQSYQKAAPQ